MTQRVHSIKESEKALLRELLEDSRANIQSLAKSLGKGRNWVARTIRKLVKWQVIRAYLTILNPAKVYAERNSILLIKSNPREVTLSRALLNMPELESLDGISGEYSLLALFRFRKSQSFNEFLDKMDKVVAATEAQKYDLVQVLATYKTHGFLVRKNGFSEFMLSDVDWSLLNTIRRWEATTEEPMSPSQRRIGEEMQKEISQPAVSKVMRRLAMKNVILGHSIDIDFKYVDLPIKFFLRIKPKPGKVAKTAEYVSLFKEVWDLHRVGGDYSLFATVRTEDIEDYNRFLRALYRNSAIIDTESQMALEEWTIPSSKGTKIVTQ
ncbi:Lrp/AsnC family transcriptional regulator [Candidatus Thorarchaeota archaeon]|nr:MAG: Lrp/AsnC family transcriptional regulator [Candidatus Thorarchaeota archaeon]